MDKEKKELFMDIANSLSGDSSISAGNEELDDIRKSCRLITFILIIICAVVILCDYFIF